MTTSHEPDGVLSPVFSFEFRLDSNDWRTAANLAENPQAIKRSRRLPIGLLLVILGLASLLRPSILTVLLFAFAFYWGFKPFYQDLQCRRQLRPLMNIAITLSASGIKFGQEAGTQLLGWQDFAWWIDRSDGLLLQVTAGSRLIWIPARAFASLEQHDEVRRLVADRGITERDPWKEGPQIISKSDPF
jgi:hypothetical protein